MTPTGIANGAFVFFANLKTVHHRWMMGYLRRRGWVVFYLEPQCRLCRGGCWLDLYNSAQKGPT